MKIVLPGGSGPMGQLHRPAAVLLSILILALAGCGKREPEIKITDVLAPASASVTVNPGMNLGEVASAAYGHGRFAGFVARLNGLKDPERVAAGAKMRTPSLAAGLHDAGLDAQYQPAINALAMASTDFYTILPAYQKARPGAVRNFAIPADQQAIFLRCANRIDAANKVLAAARSPHRAPRSAIDQFAKVSSQLRTLATGAMEEYDTEMVGQRLGIGFTNLIVWVQEKHQ